MECKKENRKSPIPKVKYIGKARIYRECKIKYNRREKDYKLYSKPLNNTGNQIASSYRLS